MTMSWHHRVDFFLLALLLLILLCCLATSSEHFEETTFNNNNNQEDNDDNNDKQSTTTQQQLIEWLRANGAYINPKVELRYIQEETGVRGVFATDTLDHGELVCRIPQHLILQPQPTTSTTTTISTSTTTISTTTDDDEYDDDNDSNCGTVSELVKAMKDKTHAYGQYLLAQPRDYLPAFWSESGEILLEEMLGEHLPPHDIDDIWTIWDEECNNNNSTDNLLVVVDWKDPLQRHAAMMVTARADYKYLIPFYDMMNHRNGQWYNVHHNQNYNNNVNDNDDDDFEVVTSKQILAGEELYNSYNQCNICQFYHDWLGTAELLNRYGFVEQMPQRWFFDDARIKFDLDYQNNDDHDHNNGGESNTTDEELLKVTFKVPLSKRGMLFLRNELKRLQEFGDKHHHHDNNNNNNTTIPQSEWDTLWQFHSALVVAITHALQQVDSTKMKLTNDVWEMGKYWYVEKGHDIPEYEDEVAVRYGHEVVEENNVQEEEEEDIDDDDDDDGDEL